LKKYLRKSTLRRKGLFWAHGFRVFSTGSLGTGVIKPVVRQNIIAESTWRSKAAPFVMTRKHKEKRARVLKPPSRACPQ
jgi:hypothetical protein